MVPKRDKAGTTDRRIHLSVVPALPNSRISSAVLHISLRHMLPGANLQPTREHASIYRPRYLRQPVSRLLAGPHLDADFTSSDAEIELGKTRVVSS